MLTSRQGTGCSHNFYHEVYRASGRSNSQLCWYCAELCRGFSAIGDEKPAYEVSGGLLAACRDVVD